MKMFSQVLIPDSKKGMEYVVTAKTNFVNPEIDSRPGPYYFVQEANKGAGKRINKANFKKGRFYNHEDVILA
tara:strand:- start:130 stop:345 length:216 start_codon:yes stop_codon:yes gene_type:complete